MRYSLYPGCLVLTKQYGYEISTRRVLEVLGIKLITPADISCCGAPLRSINSYGWIYLTARNMAALEELKEESILLCNWCHLSFTHVRKIIEEEDELRDWVNELLKNEDLEYRGRLKFKHLIEVLYNDIGINKIKSLVKIKLDKLILSVHPGCQFIRPTKLGRPDNALQPHKLSELVEALGAKTKNHPGRLECCGWAISKTDIDSGLTLAGRRIRVAKEAEVSGIVVTCPHGAEMMDKKQEEALESIGIEHSIPVLYYTQLLGLALEISPRELGLQLNKSPTNKILESI